MNYLARPNDLGLSALDIDKFKKTKGKTGNVTGPTPPPTKRSEDNTKNKERTNGRYRR